VEGEVIAGGATDGIVTGAGGEDVFCVGGEQACGDFTDRAEVSITVTITTRTFADEIQWNIDGGTMFGIAPSFEENQVAAEVLELPEGEHRISFFDSFGDGWHGGYWEITDCLGNTIAGGPAEGQVSGDGGEEIFNVVANDGCPGAAPAPPPPPLCADVTCPEATSDCKVAGECRPEDGSCGAETNVPEGTECDDMDATTVDDMCSSWGVCTGTNLCDDVTCTASSDCKVAGECAAMTGQCTDEMDAPDGIGCDDGDVMTNSDVCTAGVCRGTGE
jgi:hypothetical protein